MNQIALITDTSSDLDALLVEKYHITQIPFYVSFNEVDYTKEIIELPITEFYKQMRAEKVFPKTSLPSITDYYDVFEPLAKEGKQIICVCLSSHFSGSYNSAVNARELILENYPDTSIEIINSLNATGGQGLLVCEIGRMIADGISFETIIETVPKLIEKARIFFYVATLDYLEHSGRIGKASALLGTMLNVKPILYLQNGLLYPIAKVRGKKKAVAKVIELAQAYVEESNQEDFQYTVGHADNFDEAVVLYDALSAVVTAPISELHFFIGTTIGVNTGPDACGVCIMPKYETVIAK